MFNTRWKFKNVFKFPPTMGGGMEDGRGEGHRWRLMECGSLPLWGPGSLGLSRKIPVP